MSKPKPNVKLRTVEPEVQYGQSIGFNSIESGGIKMRTWLGYIKFITKFYKQLDLPDHGEFYWEYLSKESTIHEIIKIILSNYHVKNGDALAAKLSPFRSVVFRLTCKGTLEAIETWGETIINARRNFNSIVAEFSKEVTIKTCKSVNPYAIIKGPGNWLNAAEQLHEMSQDKSLDSRVRVLATIYKYGYVFRISVIFRTYIHLGGDGPRPTYNYLDLDNETWSIIDDGVQKVEFQIPAQMAKELQSLTVGGPFIRGWLLPQRRGLPYAAEASISSFSSWTKIGLANYRTYRRLFNDWLKSRVSDKEYQLFLGILDQHISLEYIRYVPPIPLFELSKDIDKGIDKGKGIDDSDDSNKGIDNDNDNSSNSNSNSKEESDTGTEDLSDSIE